ncbi:hypothetical protein M419DRAFT_117676 [Trichoderma reesei RUT C-30]|uniref:Uncharacterized protein n=1 Tax=Hypocrea jecorina (strain ATCC 56765 / BCRC 32924 / NRRL 11460 / Rut C-30) TaxID=1344414 RepID=A0A024SIF0_HYPJR|nr:hypothetical protein M419DRAFT_117676 [Trichoderma reesei RUT C-30]
MQLAGSRRRVAEGGAAVAVLSTAECRGDLIPSIPNPSHPLSRLPRIPSIANEGSEKGEKEESK